MGFPHGRCIAHCPYCGHAYTDRTSWPLNCHACEETLWRNPLPAAVTTARDTGGQLSGHRRDPPCSPPPGRGRLALPWGYLEVGESWREAAVRELREETGLMASAHGVRLFAAHSTRNTLEVFALLPTRAAAGLPEMARTTETQGCCVLSEAVELAFPDTPRPWPLPWPDARCSPP